MKDQSIMADRGEFSLNVSLSGINRATPQPPCAFTYCEMLGDIGMSIQKTGGDTIDCPVCQIRLSQGFEIFNYSHF